MTHFATPRKVVAELDRYGFRFIVLQGVTYPKKNRLLLTEWYYYASMKGQELNVDR